ncbi:MAG: helix-turn-helix transcriptional regulator [Dehalococcoidia bacterium]
MASAARSSRYRQFLGRLRAARAAAGLTQAQVAQHLSRPQSFVSKCESGERRVDVVELEAFAELYGKELTYFLPPR